MLNEEMLVLFSLILMRMSGCVFLNPFFRRSEVPSMVKAGIAFLLTLILVSSTPQEIPVMENSLVFGSTLLQEFAVGAVLGFLMELFLSIMSMAGALIDFQMGLSMATVYDAGTSSQSALSGTLLYLYMGLSFFAVDGHLALIKILADSGRILPYGAPVRWNGVSQAMLTVFPECVLLAVKLSFPMIAIEFVTEMAVGILMKVIPQINIFILSIQIKIVVGVLVFIFLIGPTGDMIGDIITDMMNSLTEMIGIMVQGTGR